MKAARLKSETKTTNKLLPEDHAVHDWYRFVLSFPAHLVRTYLWKFTVGPTKCVLDPFCGTGTTAVECQKLGIRSIGIEANPMAHFAARVKADWRPDPDGLVRHARKVAEAASEQFCSEGIDEPALPLFQKDRETEPELRSLPDEQTKLLIKDSISPLPLHKTLVLLDHLDRLSNKRYRDHELLALAKALVHSIGNLRFGPEVGAGRVKEDAPVITSWLAEIRGIAADLRQLSGRKDSQAKVFLADAREVDQVLKPCSVDAVITSPPYPNEKDYSRTTRLESVLLGFIRDKADLRAVKRGLVRSNTRGVYKGDDDDRWVAEHPEVQRVAEAIEARRIEMGKTSGFERMYHRVARLYFGGMARHLAVLRKVLRPGARLAYVVGDQASYLRVMIRTGELLADIARSLGYDHVGTDLFRTRMATATKEHLREEVVLLRWPGGG